mmetsp:Transcript_1369/g.2898  ORF Transcript_1369/g.2898 Transcript_1369/m.2898 type:complete len:231 (+) Transcript_1369:210-902(+)
MVRQRRVEGQSLPRYTCPGTRPAPRRQASRPPPKATGARSRGTVLFTPRPRGKPRGWENTIQRELVALFPRPSRPVLFYSSGTEPINCAVALSRYVPVGPAHAMPGRRDFAPSPTFIRSSSLLESKASPATAPRLARASDARFTQKLREHIRPGVESWWTGGVKWDTPGSEYKRTPDPGKPRVPKAACHGRVHCLDEALAKPTPGPGLYSPVRQDFPLPRKAGFSYSRRW